MPRALAVLALLLASLGGASGAHAAPPVLVMLEPERRDVLAPALEVELASREAEVWIVDAPTGETPLARAAAAQEACRFAGGMAAVFVEGGTVRVVGADGDAVRHAPLPSPYETIDPRVFAVVAHSLLAELVGPPDPPIRVTVAIDAPGREVTLARVVPGENGGGTAEVHVSPGASPAALAAPPAPPTTPAPPSESAADFEAWPLSEFRRWPVSAEAPEERALADGDADDPPLLPRNGFFVEANVLFAGIATGGGLGLGFHLNEALRLSLSMNAAAVLIDGGAAYMPQLSLARVGGSRNGRFDFGAQAGLVFVEETVEEYGTLSAAPVTASGGSDGETTIVGSESYTYDVVRVGWALGGFFGWAWEVDDWIGVGVRLSLQVASIEGSGPVLAPMLIAHTELPI